MLAPGCSQVKVKVKGLGLGLGLGLGFKTYGSEVVVHIAHAHDHVDGVGRQEGACLGPEGAIELLRSIQHFVRFDRGLWLGLGCFPCSPSLP